MEKDNKKIIIPIIIGIVLLIAIVVGITYAYFQANNTASGTTTLDATTEAVGNVIVSNPTENLYIKLFAYEMQQSQAGNSYYAITTNSGDTAYSKEKQNNIFAQYSISGGEEDTIYNCTFKLNVDYLQENDFHIELDFHEGAAILDFGTDYNGIGYNKLYTAKSDHPDGLGYGAPYTIVFTHKGNGTGNIVTGDILLNNLNYKQNDLIGADLSTDISVSDLSCKIASKSDDTICTLDEDVDGNGYISTGDRYLCKVKDEMETEFENGYTFYVASKNIDGTTNLIMDRNICEDGSLATSENTCLYDFHWLSEGPTEAIAALNNATGSWKNELTLNETYTDEDVGGYTISLTGKARLPKRFELLPYNDDTSAGILANYLFENLDGTSNWNIGGTRPTNNITGITGYYTMFTANANSNVVVHSSGEVYEEFNGNYGLRPVITVQL